MKLIEKPVESKAIACPMYCSKFYPILPAD